MTWLWRLLKGIVQPFELGGVTMLIRSAVKNWRSGNFLFLFLNDTISWEEHKTIFSGLRISEMTLSNQIIRLEMLWLKFVPKNVTELANGQIQLILPWNGLQGTLERRVSFSLSYGENVRFCDKRTGTPNKFADLHLRINHKKLQIGTPRKFSDLWLRNKPKNLRNYDLCADLW